MSAEEEMVEGFMDGYDLTCPDPGPNRSAAYKHGFANGRDDKAGKPRASYKVLCTQADMILAEAESLPQTGLRIVNDR